MQALVRCTVQTPSFFAALILDIDLQMCERCRAEALKILKFSESILRAAKMFKFVRYTRDGACISVEIRDVLNIRLAESWKYRTNIDVMYHAKISKLAQKRP